VNGRYWVVRGKRVRVLGRWDATLDRSAPRCFTVTPFAVNPHEQSYRRLKGHRLVVQVQNVWSIIIDRNPQTWVPNVFLADAADFKPLTHRVWRTRDQASRPETRTVRASERDRFSALAVDTGQVVHSSRRLTGGLRPCAVWGRMVL
jgi:hypothetical protein